MLLLHFYCIYLDLFNSYWGQIMEQPSLEYREAPCSVQSETRALAPGEKICFRCDRGVVLCLRTIISVVLDDISVCGYNASNH